MRERVSAQLLLAALLVNLLSLQLTCEHVDQPDLWDHARARPAMGTDTISVMRPSSSRSSARPVRRVAYFPLLELTSAFSPLVIESRYSA